MRKNLDKRFEEVYRQGGALAVTGYRIIMDKETGVQYLLSWVGSSGGITPLLDKDGNPVVK